MRWHGAKVEHAENATFEEHDATTPLPFRDESVDYINLSLAQSFLLKEQWPRLLAECRRILRPGGWLRSVEWIALQTNSQAHRKLNRMFSLALEKEGRRYVELAPFLLPLLKDAGLAATPLTIQVSDFSEDAPAHTVLAEDSYVGAHILVSFLVKHGVASEEEAKQTIEEMQRDMMLPGYYALVLLSDISAQKPT